MICAIDFGSCWIRSVFRNPRNSARLSMYAERSEYALIPDTEQHRWTLTSQGIPFADCEGQLVVVGNNAGKTRWLSSVPCTPLFAEGVVSSDDPPARQMLNILVEAILPDPEGLENLCAITMPGCGQDSTRSGGNDEFLSRLVRMRGFQPLVVNPAESALLANGHESAFTGISVVIGAEMTHICVARHGRVVASEAVLVGSNWIDMELARQFKIQTWDPQGHVYLDLEKVRNWKHEARIHLQTPSGERERAISSLYTNVLDQVSTVISGMLDSGSGLEIVSRQRLPVMVSGGAVAINGFAELMTDRLIDHGVADRLMLIRVSDSPEIAVVRGSLIKAELEAGFQPGRLAA